MAVVTSLGVRPNNQGDALVPHGRGKDPEYPAQESPSLKKEASVDASSKLLCWHGSRSGFVLNGSH